MKLLNSTPASGLSKSYVNAEGKLVLSETPQTKVGRITKGILEELPTSVHLMIAGMFFTQLYLLFNIFQVIQSPTAPKDIRLSLFMFTILGVFICIALKLGRSLVSQKEEALNKAALLKKARNLPNGLS